MNTSLQIFLLIEPKTALDQLSRNDITVQGILFFVILVLISFVVYLLRKADQIEKSQQEEAKANLKMISDITNVITNSQDKIGEVKDIVSNNNNTSKAILTIIKERGT